MKILMATMGLDIGGAETHIVELAKELTRMGHRVIIASNGGVYVPEIEAAGIRHIKVPMHRRSPALMLSAFLKLRRIIRTERPDVVHAHARIPGFICGLVRKTLRFPFVTTAHGVFSAEGMLRFLTNWGDKTIAVSEDISEYVKSAYGVKEENIFLTINGVDTEKFSPKVSGAAIRAEFAIPEDAPVVVHVSRLDAESSLAARLLIDAAPRMAAHIPGSVLLIAGGGDVYDELSARAEEVNRVLGRRYVIMTGPRTDINEIVAAGDVFVGVSRAALEAMAVEKPVVLAGAQGYQGVFNAEKLPACYDNNFCCRGFALPTADDLLGDVTGLFAETADKRRELGALGRKVVLENYSVNRMAQDTLRAYRAAVPARKVVLSGYYGFGNSGDEAILKSVIESVKKCCPDAEITVLSATPEETEKTYGCKAVGRFDPIRLFSAVKNCDTLISGGGSLLQDATSTRSLLYYTALMRLAEKLGKRVIVYANGIGPVTREKNRNRVRRAIMAADAVSLRDPQSLTELRDMGVERGDMEVTADPVFLLEPAGEEEARCILAANGISAERYITVSVRPWEGQQDFSQRIAAICDRLYEKTGCAALFICMQPGVDETAALAVKEKMTAPAFILPGGLNAEQLMSVMGAGELNLAMRLHALIFAARAGVPSVGFSYDPKTEAYLKILEQPSAGDVSDIDVEAAVSAAMDIMENRAEHCEKLRGKRAELVKAAAANEMLIL